MDFETLMAKLQQITAITNFGPAHAVFYEDGAGYIQCGGEILDWFGSVDALSTTLDELTGDPDHTLNLFDAKRRRTHL